MSSNDQPHVEAQATPDPATTQWVPLGPGIVGPQGPTGPAGATGPAGPGLPTPVVNGQWIKGVGGAAVWAGITQSDLPQNGPISQRTTIWNNVDLNLITASGWYNGASLGNAPGGRGDWLFVMHMTHQNGGWATQVCWTMQTTPVISWVRFCDGTNWQPWIRQGQCEYPQALGLTNGWGNYGSGFTGATFFKDGSNIVHLDGLIQGGSGLIAYLPGGYTPSGSKIFPVNTDNGIGRVDVQASGAIVQNGGGNQFLTLAPISFLAATYT